MAYKNGEVFELVNISEARKGDYAVMNDTCGWVTAGKHYEVLNVNPNGGLDVLDDGDDHAVLYEGAYSFDVYRKVGF